ncbi:hypothetical protein [Natrinema gelatinilyticum]|uniref:hypothetical protein n=1 Tax=Natrinema gelatinilyticum TaxID=2961571 RepID=UPI0020C4EA33|nr:hypothetical protein [Natrinema gelatinilyticum]
MSAGTLTVASGRVRVVGFRVVASRTSDRLADPKLLVLDTSIDEDWYYGWLDERTMDD